MLQNKLKSKGGPSTDSVEAKAPTAVASPAVKIVGRKACRDKGERVHFCIRCDFPIAIYGRLSPCQHAFCLDCAKMDPTCFICKEPIEKIDHIKLFGGIWICAAPQCLRSYLKKDEFENHVLKDHGDILIPCPKKGEEKESEATISAGKPTSESIVQAPAKSGLSLSSSSLQRDQDGGTSQLGVLSRKNVDAFENLSLSDAPERVADFKGNVEQNKPSNLALYPAPANKDVEHLSGQIGQHAIGPRDVTGMLPPPPGSRPPFTSQLKRGHSLTGGASRNAQAPGGQAEHGNKS